MPPIPATTPFASAPPTSWWDLIRRMPNQPTPVAPTAPTAPQVPVPSAPAIDPRVAAAFAGTRGQIRNVTIPQRPAPQDFGGFMSPQPPNFSAPLFNPGVFQRGGS